jgi:hypothetical protein
MLRMAGLFACLAHRHRVTQPEIAAQRRARRSLVHEIRDAPRIHSACANHPKSVLSRPRVRRPEFVWSPRLGSAVFGLPLAFPLGGELGSPEDPVRRFRYRVTAVRTTDMLGLPGPRHPTALFRDVVRPPAPLAVLDVLTHLFTPTQVLFSSCC